MGTLKLNDNAVTLSADDVSTSSYAFSSSSSAVKTLGPATLNISSSTTEGSNTLLGQIPANSAIVQCIVQVTAASTGGNQVQVGFGTTANTNSSLASPMSDSDILAGLAAATVGWLGKTGSDSSMAGYASATNVYFNWAQTYWMSGTSTVTAKAWLVYTALPQS